MVEVPTEDFVRAVGHWLNEALHRPITLTHRGRARLILLSREAWDAALAEARNTAAPRA